MTENGSCWRAGAPPRLLLQNRGTPLDAARHSRCTVPSVPSSPIWNPRFPVPPWGQSMPALEHAGSHTKSGCGPKPTEGEMGS